jgi:regulator of protease activity HflC (stomatin/prohibitin superfamily)
MFGVERDVNYRIKNNIRKTVEKDFEINPVNFFIFIIFVTAGLILFFRTGKASSVEDVAILVFYPCLIGCILIFAGMWETVIIIGFLTIFLFMCYKGADSFYYSIPVVAGTFVSSAFQMAKEWERTVILRMGKYHKTKGPGLFFLMPFLDTVIKVVDLRTRVTDFVAETTLTKDSVTVTVDALCFWLVWDAEKSILEVENYMEAVVLSSQTALRNAISMNTLSVLLEESDVIEEHVRKEVDMKTTEWGITVQHIEITDIQVPKDLQDSLSRLAQAEREKKSRILLGEAEIEVAKKLEEASKIYNGNDTALRLKKLSVINEGLKSGNSMILVPSNISEELETDNIFGVKAINEINKLKKDGKGDEKKRNDK